MLYTLVSPLDIDQIDQPLPRLHPPYILQQDIRGYIELPLCIAREVRRDDAFGVGPERVAGREGFGIGHVQSGTEEPGRVEGFEEFFCGEVSFRSDPTVGY